MEREDGELVTAQPRHEVAFADSAAETSRDLDEQQVTDMMAERVVDLLEVVEVEQHDRKRALVEVDTGLAQAREEQRAVGQAGQRVVQRLVLAL